MKSVLYSILVLSLLLHGPTALRARDKHLTVPLWPGPPPGDKGEIGEEKDMTKPTDNKIDGKPVIRLGNVSNPTLTVYQAPKRKSTGATILVCPGGAYHILALDLEGTEVCEW